ncbi:hypothetical protein [Streptomyces crystallinus]|uniref:Uncharacterized protein n=1 Tax=Streptomyces crystallinus TaxID=68191 RepID=A0ABN1GR69_9ACTN
MRDIYWCEVTAYRIYTLGCHDDMARYALSAVSLAVLRSSRRHDMAPGRPRGTPHEPPPVCPV